MGWVMMFSPFVSRRPIVLACAAILIGAVAVIDWRVAVNVSFGFLYVFPVMLAASVLPRGAIAVTAGLCTVRSDLFDPFPTALSVGLLSDVSAFAALTGAGLFVHEVIKSRQEGMEHLQRLVETLNKIASLELKHSTSGTRAARIDGGDLVEMFDSLRVVLESSCEEAGITVRWEIPEGLPPVWADRHLLLQALLNLTKNAERALEGADVKRIGISVSVGKGHLTIRVTDTGPGIGSADKLFRPFQAGAESTGLGLFLSRSLVRSFRGDLRYDPTVPGCSFVIDLAVAGSTEKSNENTGGHEANTSAVV